MCKYCGYRPRMIQGHPRLKIIMPIDNPGVVSYSTSIDPIMVSVTVLEIFDIKTVFHRSNDEDKFYFRFGGHASFGFPPKTARNHTSRDSTLVASLVKISGGLRSVERLTRFV